MGGNAVLLSELTALRGPAAGLTDAQLAAIRMHTPDAKIPYHEAVRRYRDEVEDETAAQLRDFGDRIARWRLCAILAHIPLWR